MKPMSDCLYFRGEKPCGIYEKCDQKCPHYHRIRHSILIIKLGALGDVIRTTPVLTYLQEKYSDVRISWLTDPNSVELLNTSRISEIIPLTWENTLAFRVRRFNTLYCFDKEIPAIALAKDVQAEKKYGFLMNEYGKLDIAGKESEYALRLGVDDELKFLENRQTYQQTLFHMMGGKFQGEEYVMPEISPDIKEKIKKRYNIDPSETVIGINIGCGHKFKTKEWGYEAYRRLIRLIMQKDQKMRPFILAGPDDDDVYRQLFSEFGETKCMFSGTKNSLETFIHLVSVCHAVVSNDSLTLHVAIGLKKWVVALFGSTAPWEIELYGRGRKLFSQRECAPCYKQYCTSMRCMRDITPEQVWEGIQEWPHS